MAKSPLQRLFLLGLFLTAFGHLAAVEITINHPSMETRIGYPAIIEPGGELPQFRIVSASAGSVEASLVRVDTENELRATTLSLAGAEQPTTLKFGGDLPGEGVYRMDLRVFDDEGLAHLDSYSFSVLDRSLIPENYSLVAHPGPGGLMRYIPDFRGNRIPDFSGVGYRGGEDPPHVPTAVTVSPAMGDATQRIQDAIDEVSARAPDDQGFRGAVQLEAGVYEIAGILRIQQSGVVLRGEGAGELREPMLDPSLDYTFEEWRKAMEGTTATVLVATGPEQRTVLTIAGASGLAKDKASSTEIVDAYVPVGQRWFHVAEPGAFSVGDTIILERRGNADWISHIKMDQIPPRPDGRTITQWKPFNLEFEYMITGISGNRITIDSGLVAAVEQRWGGGRILRYSEGGRIRDSGVENLRAVSFWQMDENGNDDTAHADQFVEFDRLRDGWARNVAAEHFSLNTMGMFHTGRDSLAVTIKDCSALAAKPIYYAGEGYDSSGRYHQASGTYVGRYGFYFGGQNGLVRNCYTANLRHAFAAASRVAGPNVFSDSMGEGSLTYSEPHHRWSVGGLYDNVSDKEFSIMNRLRWGSGHGWAGANYVAWNTTGRMICEQPPTAQNWAIGHSGEKVDGPFHEWNLENYGLSYGYWEAQNQRVEPVSLYTRQIADREAATQHSRTKALNTDQQAASVATGHKGLLNLERLRAAREAIARGEGPIAQAWPAQRRRAEAILAANRDYSVTYNKTVHANGNPHDYYSTGPYWWPNPDTPDGLPYVRRDGEINPERDEVSDRDAFRDMVKDVRTLSYAFALSGEEKFAARAAYLLRVFFFNPETYMRPNLNFTQAIPGRVTGRGTGIIDLQTFVHLVDSLTLLDPSDAWSQRDADAMRAWVNDYLDWLLAHPHGVHERNAANNHGSAFDLQVVSLALYTGRKELARIFLEEETKRRIEAQIEPDGRQPLELARTRSWSYTGENLRHFIRLGLLARHVDIDLFAYEAENGASIKAALDFALPYVCDPDPWPHEQVTAWDNVHFREILSVTQDVFPDKAEAIEAALQCVGDIKGETFFYLYFVRPSSPVADGSI